MQTNDTEKTALSRLSDVLGVSRATVSKTIRHCSGVDSETRRRILRAAREVDALTPRVRCGIYCIFPDTPSFFWKELRRGIIAGISQNGLPKFADCMRATPPGDISLSVKCNVYTHLRDEESVLAYLEEAEQMDARCIIIAAAVTEPIRVRLTQFCRRADRLVLLLSEYGHVPNAFYIGGDAYEDGAEMARRFLLCHTKAPLNALFCLRVPGNDNVTRRIQGFCDTLPSGVIPQEIPLAPERLSETKTLPSYLAATLTEAFAHGAQGNTSCALYVPLGLPGLMLALEKAGLAARTHCFCHDRNCQDIQKEPTSEKQTAAHIAAICLQDVYMQGMTAIGCSAEYLRHGLYPCTKVTTVPSIIL